MNLSPDTEKIIAIHLGNEKVTKKVVEEAVQMCKAIRDMMKDSREEGREEVIKNMIMNHISDDIIIKCTSISLEKLSQFKKEAAIVD